MNRSLVVVIIIALAVATCSSLSADPVAIITRSPSSLTVRLPKVEPSQLYSVTYDDGKHHFVWDNLSPDANGSVILRDDKHLRPEYRLRAASRTHPGDPVIFDDLMKGAVVGKRRAPYGVPVSTFGGPGYLVPGLSELKRDVFGGFWLYLDHPPYALLKYNREFQYRFALLLPGPPIAFDTDAEGNLYVLHSDNWLSKHSPLGESLGAWELPRGRGPGQFISASGMVIDRDDGLLYLADVMLSRVQRFSLDLRLRPFPQTTWGWIGREDLAYTRLGQYDGDRSYYLLDRPRQLLLDGRGNLLVSCEHYISRFDLSNGRQIPFGKNPVLGWGGTFTDSPLSSSAALDGHWQRHWLSGVDTNGDIYLSDRENEFVINPRLQVFSAEGDYLRTYDLERGLVATEGNPVYPTAVRGLACAEEALWLVDAAGRVYQSPSSSALTDGGRLFLGPGAAGRQFDLSETVEANFKVERQSSYIVHRSEGLVIGFPPDERGTANCEKEGKRTLKDGERSLWMPVRLGEPFKVTLFDSDGRVIPNSQYSIEFEEKPGLFGTQYDYFRVTNLSGQTWQEVRFAAEAGK